MTQTSLSKPGEIRKVALTGELPATALPGEIHVLRISQRIGQTIVGGYTLYVTAKSNTAITDKAPQSAYRCGLFP